MYLPILIFDFKEKLVVEVSKLGRTISSISHDSIFNRSFDKGSELNEEMVLEINLLNFDLNLDFQILKNILISGNWEKFKLYA